MGLVVLGVMWLLGCGAPRDPVLEQKFWEARLAADKALRSAEGATPAPAPAPAPTPTPTPGEKPPDKTSRVAPQEVRAYSSTEVATMLGGLAGTGPAVLAEITTELGVVNCRLDPDLAPQTVANFVGLASGTLPWKPGPRAEPVVKPFYNGLPFYRVVPNFLVEAGDPEGDVTGPGFRIQRERGAERFFDEPGAIAMLSDSGAIHGSRFFITVRAAKELADRYNAFGRCGDLEIVKKIAEGEQVTKDTPKSPVKILGVKVTRGN